MESAQHFDPSQHERQLTISIIRVLIDEILQLLSDKVRQLPFLRSDRNDSLRQDILVRVASQLLTDDERAELLGLPEGCRIREGAKILSPENLTIGKRCWIGENAVLDASGGLEIGSDCSIGLSVFVWSHSSHLTNLSRQNVSGSPLIQRRKTIIGSGVFIAGPSVIMPGTVIGDNVVVRPFSTVSGVVRQSSLVSGESVIPDVFNSERIARMIARHENQEK